MFQVVAKLSFDNVVLFESKNADNCKEVCADYRKSLRKVKQIVRRYYGDSEIDGVYVQQVNK